MNHSKKNSSGTILLKGICIVSAALLLTLPLTGCYFFPKEEEVLAPPIKAPARITYETVEVKRGNIENVIMCTGNFVSVSQKDLYFVKTDRLKDIYVTSGRRSKRRTPCRA